jgi:hypothetical protein
MKGLTDKTFGDMFSFLRIPEVNWSFKTYRVSNWRSVFILLLFCADRNNGYGRLEKELKVRIHVGLSSDPPDQPFGIRRKSD